MRRIVVSQFITLDGVIEAPETWNKSYLDDAQVVRGILEDFANSDAVLLGRTSFDFFAARWPSRSGEMAEQFNTIAKFVVSSSSSPVSWNNSTIIGADSLSEIKKLKHQQGKDILVFGSYQLLQTLSREHLVDEYKMYIYPITLGKGKRLFEEGAPQQSLKLVASQTFASGVISLTYQPEKHIEP